MKDYTNKQIPFRITGQVFHLLLIIGCVIFPCCKSDIPEEKIREVDSLLALTVDIQKKISSSEIQMLNDFNIEIDRDLSYLIDTVGYEFPLLERTKEFEEYINLRDDMENCLAACSNYSEEVFMIENNLTDIRDRLIRNDKNHEELGRLIKTEKELLDDLLLRIDGNIGYIDREIEEYLYLKPIIDELKLNLTAE